MHLHKSHITGKQMHEKHLERNMPNITVINLGAEVVYLQRTSQEETNPLIPS